MISSNIRWYCAIHKSNIYLKETDNLPQTVIFLFLYISKQTSSTFDMSSYEEVVQVWSIKD